MATSFRSPLRGGKGGSPMRGGIKQNSGARVVTIKGAPSGSSNSTRGGSSNGAPSSSSNGAPSSSSNNKYQGNNYRKFRCEFIRGKKWYPLLVHKDNRKKWLCLLEDLGYNSNNIYVRLTTGDRFMFSSFKDAIELRKYIEQFAPSLKCFDEIIMEGPQKPRFDIDLEDNALTDTDLDRMIQLIINQIIDGILFYLPEIILEKNIRLFTSHGVHKRSVHIVIDGYFHDNYMDARGFYDDVIKHVSKPLMQYVDHGIYGKKKQLRMMNCCKWKSDRIKTLQEHFTYYDKRIICDWGELDNDVTRFVSSLITVIVGCNRLRSFAKKSAYAKTSDVPDGVAGKAIEMTKLVLGKDYTFELESVTGSIIVLRRILPSKCIICDKVHESQHPFLYILNNRVYLNCRRHPQNKSHLIGNLLTTDITSIEKEIPAARIDKKTESGKTIEIGGGTFTFRKKNSPLDGTVTENEVQENDPSTGESSSRELLTEDEDLNPDPDIFCMPETNQLSSKSTIMDRLGKLNKPGTTRKRIPKNNNDVPLSSLINYNNIDMSK